MNKKSTIIIFLLVLTLLTTACTTDLPSGDVTPGDDPAGMEQSDNQEPEDQPQLSLEGTRWELISIYGEALVEGSHINLEITADRLGGHAGCNSYGTSIEDPPPSRPRSKTATEGLFERQHRPGTELDRRRPSSMADFREGGGQECERTTRA